MTERLRTRAGTVVLVEESHALPLVHVGVSLRTGSTHDPKGREGLTRITSRLLRMGAGKLQATAIEERIDALGAQLSIGSAPSYVHIGGAVVAHNLEPFFALLSELICAPALRERDLARVRRETSAELTSSCDDDRTLAARNFRAFAFGAHPYGRPVSGNLASVQNIKRADVLRHYAAHFRSQNAVVGMAGAVSLERAVELTERYLKLPRGKAPVDRVPEPETIPGRRVLLVDKPERTQTQIIIGTLGTQLSDPDHIPLSVGNTVFGGLFTARLTHEVRSVHGWSYGASSSLGNDRQRELWSMWTFPAAKDAIACIKLQLALYDAWVTGGVTPGELRKAKSYLIKSNAFEIDTAAKRLDQSVETEVFALPEDYHTKFPERVQGVTRAAVGGAIKKRLSRRDQTIVVVATAKELEKQLAKLPRVHGLEVVPFDRV